MGLSQARGLEDGIKRKTNLPEGSRGQLHTPVRGKHDERKGRSPPGEVVCWRKVNSSVCPSHAAGRYRSEIEDPFSTVQKFGEIRTTSLGEVRL